MPDVPAGSVTSVTCPVLVGMVEKLYPVIVTPAPVVGGIKEIPIEVAALEVTANVPGADMMVDTCIVAGDVFPKRVVASVPNNPVTDRLYLVPADRDVGDATFIFAEPLIRLLTLTLLVTELVKAQVAVIGVPPETGVSV